MLWKAEKQQFSGKSVVCQYCNFYERIMIYIMLSLQLLCRLVFTQKYQFHPNLLCDPPASIAEPLKRVLRDCSKPGPSHMNWQLYDELKDLLTNSIRQST